MKPKLLSVCVALLLCSCAHFNEGRKEISGSETSEARAAVDMFKKHDEHMKKFFNTAYGYAIFPSIGKAGLGLGGAHGEGLVYRQGDVYGFSVMSQLTVGLQVGGQVYSEIIFFEDKRAFDRFTGGNFEFNAQASAVALRSGVSSNSSYQDGVAIFTMAKAGLMFEASVGGQKFSFQRPTNR